jgi:hypothetical protein
VVIVLSLVVLVLVLISLCSYPVLLFVFLLVGFG